MISTVGEFVLKGILLGCSSRESCLDLQLRMTKHTRTHSTVIIIINNDTVSADAIIMLPSRSDIVGAGIVVPLRAQLYIAIAVGRFAPSVLEFVAIVEFFIRVCVG